MAEKLTIKQKFEAVKEYLTDRPDLIEFIDERIAQASKKSSKSTTPTKAQMDNEMLAEIVKTELGATDKGMSISQMLALPSIADFVTYDGKAVSSSKLTAVVTAMTEPTERYPDRTGEIVRSMEKKTAIFKLA